LGDSNEKEATFRVRWGVPLAVGAALVLALSCAARSARVRNAASSDAGTQDGSPAGEAGLEIGDGGQSLGAPGLAMFMAGPRHRGRSAYEGPATAPQELWAFHTGARIFASPVVGSDGTIYVGSIDGSFNALSPEGRVRWTYVGGGPIFSSAAVSSTGHVYVGCDDGSFLAFHPSGRVLWSDRRSEAFDSSPVIGDDGSVYIGGEGLHAFTPRGGRRWRIRTGTHIFSPPVVHPRRLVVFGGPDGVLRALHDDGREAFQVQLEGAIVGGATVLETGAIVVGSGGGQVVAIDRDGQQLWETREAGPVGSTPAVGLDGNIYVTSENGRLSALSPETGDLLWQVQTGGPLRASPMVDASGRIFIGSQDHYLYCLDPDGSIRWQHQLGGEIDSTGAIGPDGSYYTGCDDGVLYALR
jgi:outer membrane protein assembly factor BamB